MNEHLEMITTKISLTLGLILGFISLSNVDLILAIVLKVISIFSFMLVMILNIDKAESTIKKWFKKKKNENKKLRTRHTK